MSDQPEENSAKRTWTTRAVWGFVYLVTGYFLFFTYLLADVYGFEGDLFCNPVFTRFPEWENAIGDGIGIVYWPLIEPLEALHLL